MAIPAADPQVGLYASVVVLVWTRDLLPGVLAGVILSGIFLAAKVRRMFSVERFTRCFQPE